MADKRDLIIIGSGPGGYVAAIRGVQAGMNVTVIEKSALGGTCLNVGCIPSKALITAGRQYRQMNNGRMMGLHAEKTAVNMNELQSWKDGIVSRLTGGVKQLLRGNGVEVIQGEATFTGPQSVNIEKGDGSREEMKFENCIIATGSSPSALPGLSWSKRILSSTEALALQEIPEKIIVVGGGYIGVELGTAYANFGSRVTFLEGSDQLLPGFEQELVKLVAGKLENRENVDVYTNAAVEKALELDHGACVTFKVDGKVMEAEADAVFVTVGRKPNTHSLHLEKAGIEKDEQGFIQADEHCRTNQPHIYAVGDVCKGPALAHRASYQGKVAAENIAGMVAFDDQPIPAVVFSEPELASVGLTLHEAEQKGHHAVKKSFPFSANGRAMTLNDTKGFVQLVISEPDGAILGAQIAGPGASELINELTMAVSAGFTAEDVSLVVHFHPSLGETVMEASELAIGYPVHML